MWKTLKSFSSSDISPKLQTHISYCLEDIRHLNLFTDNANAACPNLFSHSLHPGNLFPSEFSILVEGTIMYSVVQENLGVIVTPHFHT